MSAIPTRGRELLFHPLGGAVIAVVHERGYRGAEMDAFAAGAGLESARLEEAFVDKATLVEAVFEAIAEDYKAHVGRAYETLDTWPDNLRAAAWATARWVLANPEAIWFGMVGVLDAPEMVLVRREELLRWCAGLVDAGRAVAPDPDSVPAAAPLMAVGAIAETLRRREEGSLPGDVVSWAPQMMYAAVRPYLGEEAALRELEITPPPDLRPSPRAHPF